MLAYLDFFLGGDEKRTDLPPGIHQRFPMPILFGGDGSYMAPFSLQNDNILTSLMSEVGSLVLTRSSFSCHVIGCTDLCHCLIFPARSSHYLVQTGGWCECSIAPCSPWASEINVSFCSEMVRNSCQSCSGNTWHTG